jgi:hypothetical protein
MNEIHAEICEKGYERKLDNVVSVEHSINGALQNSKQPLTTIRWDVFDRWNTV